MRVFILLLLLAGAAYADTSTNTYATSTNTCDAFTNSSPKFFKSAAEMHQWAMSTWGGAGSAELTYKKQKLVVYFRSYTSGVPTSEPFVFVEKKWRVEACSDGDVLRLRDGGDHRGRRAHSVAPRLAQ